MDKEVKPGAASNLIAYRLGLVGKALTKYPESDEIDRGLLLCRLLTEAGFKLLYSSYKKIILDKSN